MAFESGGVPEDWRSAVIVLLYKGKKLNVITIEVLVKCDWKNICGDIFSR